MPAVNFNSSNNFVKPPSGSKLLGGSMLDLRGLDLTTPVDAIRDGRTPFAKNFRLQAQQEDSRRVAVSSRKGQGYIMDAVGQTVMIDEDGTTDADVTTVGIIENVQAVRFEALSTERMTRVDIKPSDPTSSAKGTLLVELWSDNDGIIAKKLAVSSIQSGSIGDTSQWLPARFVKAVQLQKESFYWIVVRMQDDGEGEYTLDTSTDYQSYATSSTLQNLTLQDYGINIRIYTAPGGVFKGGYRYLRDNGDNVTVVAYDDGIYYLDDDKLVLITDGLSPNAEHYSFASADNKLFWVNGYDDLTYWDGTYLDTNSNKILNPTLDVNASDWYRNEFHSGTVSRTTSAPQAGAGCLSITNTSGVRAGWTPLVLEKFHKYRVSFHIKVATNGNVTIHGLDKTPTNLSSAQAATIGSVIAATTSWQLVEFDYVATQPFVGIQWSGAAGVGTIFLDNISVKDYGIAHITDDQLDIADTIVYHKDRLWTKSASNYNKLQFSEAPGNPTAKTDSVGNQIPTSASEQWYNSWRSVDYWYVPRPFNGSPVVGTISFQDALTVFTQDNKYIISGYDTGSFFLRQSTGAMGALSWKSIAVDENYIYFVGKDGFYRYNGSSDEKISKLVSPLFDACPRKEDIRPVVWKNQVRFYMASSGSTENDMCLIWDKDLEEWQLDTDTYVDEAIWYKDTDDDQDLIEFSSVVPVLYRAEENYHSLGAPIDFEYRFKYESMKSPGQKKRIKRFVPILQGVDTTFPLTIAMDKDFQDSPKIKKVMLTVNGAVLDDFKLGDGTLLGGDKSFRAKRQSYSGYAHYWQFRLLRNAVNNRVAFVGAQYTYKIKRL